jgi:hypothetical protein
MNNEMNNENGNYGEGQISSSGEQQPASDDNDYEDLKATNKPSSRTWVPTT